MRSPARLPRPLGFGVGVAVVALAGALVLTLVRPGGGPGTGAESGTGSGTGSGAGSGTGSGAGPGTPSAHGPAPPPDILAGKVGASVAPAGGTDSGPAAADSRTRADPRAARAARVLARWDRRRAAAYRHGSVRELRSLYHPGAGTADVSVLRAYVDRGLRVTRMRMQLLAVRVLGRRPGRWRLRVTDRLQRAVATGSAGSHAAADAGPADAGPADAGPHTNQTVLPRDRASTRVLVLRRGADGAWRVARVSRPQDRGRGPAPSRAPRPGRGGRS